MLTHPITDARAWRADTIDHRNAWYQPLSKRLLAAWEETRNALVDVPEEVTRLRVEDTRLAGLADELKLATAALDRGRGFVILETPRDRYSDAELTSLYWLLGQLLGPPRGQNVEGTLLYDVRDTGQDVRYGARFSVTSAESSFHTDNSFGAEALEYVGLLCLKTARSGGLSQLVSAYSVHNVLLERHRTLLESLYSAFHVDRRGGLQPGDAPTVLFPILDWTDDVLTCRYLRYWIETGHDKAGAPLSAVQIEALDTLDRVAADRSLRVEFALKPGDMFFINNRWIFHNRTAFDDHAEPERKRHLIRLWLR